MLQRACVGGWWWVERCVVLEGEPRLLREPALSPPAPHPAPGPRARAVRGPPRPRAARAAGTRGRDPRHTRACGLLVPKKRLRETSRSIRD